MRVAIPKELAQSEQRVALVPSLVSALQKMGSTILFEKGAGSGAFYLDNQYEGVEFYTDPIRLYQAADVVLKVDAPLQEETRHLKKNAILIGLLSPHRFPERILALRDGHITSFAMELLPRISRAQSMDALSSQATVAGYKAALIAANSINKFFPMLTTAAGTIRPVNVLVIGAGVAGLQAIATARRLGALVKAYDIRPAAREQIESLGARMIHIEVKADTSGGYARELSEAEKQLQQAALKEAISKTDVIISTAAIPGKPAPKIISKEMVESMIPGSVIIDIAAQSGGNCELTQPDNTFIHQGVTIIGPTNVPSMLAQDASNMYAKNLLNFLSLILKEGQIHLDWQDPILAESVLTHEGVIKHQATAQLIEGVRR